MKIAVPIINNTLVTVKTRVLSVLIIRYTLTFIRNNVQRTKKIRNYCDKILKYQIHTGNTLTYNMTISDTTPCNIIKLLYTAEMKESPSGTRQLCSR